MDCDLELLPERPGSSSERSLSNLRRDEDSIFCHALVNHDAENNEEALYYCNYATSNCVSIPVKNQYDESH